MGRAAGRRAFVCAGLWFAASCAATPVDSAPLAEARQQLASGRSASEQRQWKAASAAFARAALIFAALDDSSAETAALRDQGEALRRAGELKGAVSVYQRALDLDRRFGEGGAQAQDLGGLARCAAAEQDTPVAIHTAEDALALAGADPPVRAVLENDLALYLLAPGGTSDPARAIELLTAASASNEAQRDAAGLASNELNLGRAEFALGDSTQAESYLQRALAGFRRLQDPAGLAETHEMLARLFLARHQVDQCRFHLEQARAGFAFLEDRDGLRRVEGLGVQ
jgi:tetratricopeptide (TPR) repeat protein